MKRAKLTNLLSYLNSLSRPERAAFCSRSGVSVGQMNNVAYGYRPCAPELAVNIERESGGAVTRQDLRPRDWARIWPEIVDRHDAA